MWRQNYSVTAFSCHPEHCPPSFFQTPRQHRVRAIAEQQQHGNMSKMFYFNGRNQIGRPVPLHSHSKSSCGSVVGNCVSSAKGCGFNSQGTHILTKKCIAWMHCKSLWIKASAKYGRSDRIVMRWITSNMYKTNSPCLSSHDEAIITATLLFQPQLITIMYIQLQKII